MSARISIKLDQIPALPKLLAQAAFSRRKLSGEPQFPSVEYRVQNVRIDRAKLSRYINACGFDNNACGFGNNACDFGISGSDEAPITYPHVLMFSLHMKIMLQKNFPFSPMGIIHLSNRITQQRPVRANEALDVRCSLAEHRPASKGTEFDIVSEARVAGQLVWEGRSVFLARHGASRSDAGKEREKAELQAYRHEEPWTLDAGLGRRYARTSGDYNPIHLFPLTAKLLGFKRQIAHGMWSKARCAAALYPLLEGEACTIAVDFKTPIFLPSKAAFCYEREDSSFRFELRDALQGRPHVTGRIDKLD